MSKREQCWQKDKKKNRSWRSCCRMIRFVCASVHFIVLVGQRPPFADVEHNGHVFYEYAFVTRKRDSRQHVMHLPTTQGMKPRLTTSKFFQDAIRHRLIRAWGKNTTRYYCYQYQQRMLSRCVVGHLQYPTLFDAQAV